MEKLVTIGIPVYKRLQYLPRLLGIVQSQDYPQVELIVSDNGRNGSEVKKLVETHYSRPCRFRQNPEIVPMAKHWNQIVGEASGEYFVNLADDDEISSNYVSDLVAQLERYPDAGVAISAQELINADGEVLRRQKQPLPERLSGSDFIVKTWQTYELGFACFSTVLARTADITACGGYIEFSRGNYMDNALLIQLCLSRSVVFSSRCLFRNRVDMSSEGWSASLDELAAATKEFLRFLDADRMLRRVAAANPAEWVEIKQILVTMAWQTYLERWRGMYRDRSSSYFQWTKAAFAMPFIAPYYRKACRVLVESFRSSLGAWLKAAPSPVER